jgi:type IV pilus assembly protein PilY1
MASGQPRNYKYIANAITGLPDARCGFQGTSGTYRASSRESVAPPLAPTWLMAIANGSVQDSTGQPGDPGNPDQTATVLGGTRSLSAPAYWLEVPRDLHECRHMSAAKCE